MIKRKSAYILVGGLLAVGLVLNAPSMANYVQNLGTATQTINAATWSVEFGNNLGEHTIFPGEEVSNDTITLTNNNDYQVKYTITLKTEDSGLDKALTLDLKEVKGDKENSFGIGNTETSQKTKQIIVDPGQTIVLKSHVTWSSTSENIEYSGKSVKYSYDIISEKTDDIKVDNSQSGIQEITVNSQAAIDKVVEDIINGNPDAKIEAVKEEEDNYVYTIRVPKSTLTFAMDTTKYDYIIVKVPKTLNDGKGLGNIERVPALTRAWAYRNNQSDTSVHVTIQTAEDLDLSTASNDNVQIHYYKEDGKTKVASRSKVNDGYLNKNKVKYPQGLVNNQNYSNDAKAGEYTSTLKKTVLEQADKVKYIQVVVTKDGRTYDSGLQEVQVRDR